MYDPLVNADAIGVLQLVFALVLMFTTAIVTFLACKPGAEKEILGNRAKDGSRYETGNANWVWLVLLRYQGSYILYV